MSDFVGQDIIDVRDVITRFEEFQERTSWDLTEEEKEEFGALTELLESLKGMGGDEQWKGDWYPITLISEGYFTQYCEDLCDDIGVLPKDIPDYIVIDWDATANNIRVDYSEVDFGGYTYLYR